jgi:hypothetical protein
MILSVKDGIDLMSADFDSIAAGLDTAGVEARDSFDQAVLEAMEQQFGNFGFTVREYGAPETTD